MAKKKTTKKKSSKKKKKLTLAQKKKYIKIASEGKGLDFMHAVKMLGGIRMPGAGMGPGTHAIPHGHRRLSPNRY